MFALRHTRFYAHLVTSPCRTLLFVQMTVDRRPRFHPSRFTLAGAREMGYGENADLHTTSNSIGN